ncbi:hypothetical protein IV203_015590 [Nitzschia inconspicua]|uniref:Uncharacterized protein n=1 Tax=Nitzschia inconspicua TaxID=303405 RepID=A0A9K3LCX8_9STRA|nr:hypothetical protein IV203_015590 [Nitzschia inconspicua]
MSSQFLALPYIEVTEDWREQYQAALQTRDHSQQKLERLEAAERELHAMIKDLQNRNVALKDWNKELQATHAVRSATVINASSSEELHNLCEENNELQTKLMNVTTTKDRAIKTLKKYHQQIKDLTSPDRDDSNG